MEIMLRIALSLLGLSAVDRPGMPVVQEDGQLLAGPGARQSHSRFEQLVLHAGRQVSPDRGDRASESFRELFRGYARHGSPLVLPRWPGALTLTSFLIARGTDPERLI